MAEKSADAGADDSTALDAVTSTAPAWREPLSKLQDERTRRFFVTLELDVSDRSTKSRLSPYPHLRE